MVGDGYDGRGNELLTYVEGEVRHPHPWSDDAIWRVGRLLRELHGATASFQPPADAVWQPWMFHSDAPDVIVDWTLAGPIDRRDEIAAAAWWNAQLHDDIGDGNQLPDAEVRAPAGRCRAGGQRLGQARQCHGGSSPAVARVEGAPAPALCRRAQGAGDQDP